MVRRAAATLFALVALAPFARGQVNLTETPAVGDNFRYGVELDLGGKLIVTQEGTKQAIKLVAKARHVFTERTLAVADASQAQSARYNEDAVASAAVDVDNHTRSFTEDR